MATYFPLLPKLKEASSVKPDKAAVWETEGRDFLNALIKSLDVGGDIKDLSRIDSIPDVWAKPLLFQMALFDEQGSASQEFVKGLHERVKGEWRSVLAMLALKNVKHLDLRAEAVNLNEDSSSLSEVLLGLAPKESIYPENTGWDLIYVIKYNGKPIAIASPTTLVAAAADYQTAFNGELTSPWSRDGYILTDPTDALTEEDRRLLYGWISKLHDELRQTVPTSVQENNEAFMKTLNALDSYRNDIARKCSSTPVADVQRTNAELGLNQGIFRLLNQTIQAKKGTAGDSAVRLITSKERAVKNDILLVSPVMARDFADELGMSATQLVIWPGVSANDIMANSLSDHKHIGSISLGNTEWRDPEEFFLERMVVMEPGGAIVGSRPIAGAQILAEDDTSVLLPIKSSLLEFFTPKEIAERISLENRAEDILVHFSFPLSGVGSGGTDFKYTKSYPKKDLIYMQTRIPVIELWPNFKREGWKKYYLYYENIEAQNKNSTGLATDFFYVRPYKFGDEDIDKNVPSGGLQNCYTAKLTDFPEALLCSVNLSNTNSVSAEAREAGLILLDEPETVAKEAGLNFKFGIDFGTSSTMLYYREGTKDPAPLAFEPHLFQVTDSDVQRTNTFLNFIPSAMDGNKDGSFLSIFQMLNKDRLDGDIRPLQDGNVFMLTMQRESKYRERAGSIDPNLKWKDDPIGRKKVAAYVKQICIQSAAEAAYRGADKIEWNFSYPTAFSGEQQFAFRNTCRDAVEEAYDAAPFSAEAGDIMESWPESKASAYYFNKFGKSDTNFGDGAICLDIGAGTTDISIISGQPGRIVYHTSIQFAGRYLFRPIYMNYDILSQNPPDTSGMDYEQLQALIDADMREHSEEYLKNLKNITGRMEVKETLQLAEFAVAGIFYYVGEILSFLHQKGMYVENHVPDIFIGGNGSRIFSWITGGTFDNSAPFLEVLKEAVVTSSGLDENSRFGIKLSASPKIEVASGMIETRPHNDGEFFDEQRQIKELFGNTKDEYLKTGVVSGESFSVEGEDFDKFAHLSARQISSGVNVNNLDELTRFITLFNENSHIWADGIEINEDMAHDLKKLVNGYYVSEKGKDVKKIFVEPVFVLGLKKIMEMLAK